MEKLSKEDLRKLAEIDPKLAKMYRKLMRLESTDQAIETEMKDVVQEIATKFDKQGFEIIPRILFTKQGVAASVIQDKKAIIQLSLMSYRRNTDKYFRNAVRKCFVELSSDKYGLKKSEIERRFSDKKEVTFPKSFKRYEYACDCHTRWVSSLHHNRIKKGLMRIHCEVCGTDFVYAGREEQITPKYLAKADFGPISSYTVIKNTEEHPVVLGAAISPVRDILKLLKCEQQDLMFA